MKQASFRPCCYQVRLPGTGIQHAGRCFFVEIVTNPVVYGSSFEFLSFESVDSNDSIANAAKKSIID